MRRLVLRQDLGLELGEPELLGDRLGGAPVVAGQHDDAQPVGAQRGERRGASSP